MLRHNNRLSLPSSSTVGYNVEINDARVKLDATCRELEKTCQKLKQERDTSIKLVFFFIYKSIFPVDFFLKCFISI